jgi:addiction module HigA family antidote
MSDFAAVHPGEILKEEFLIPLGISPYALAKALGVAQTRISEIIHGRRAITADTALRLARYFTTTPEFWMNLQSHYDLETERDRAAAKIEERVKPRETAAA